MQKLVHRLETYLHFSKYLIKPLMKGKLKFPVNIIMCNESADSDSIFGAISFGYLHFL